MMAGNPDTLVKFFMASNEVKSNCVDWKLAKIPIDKCTRKASPKKRK
jgi:hypothetical protein